jgi:hypothetical protein
LYYLIFCPVLDVVLCSASSVLMLVLTALCWSSTLWVRLPIVLLLPTAKNLNVVYSKFEKREGEAVPAPN